MNIALFILTGFLISCNSQNNDRVEVKTKVVQDTIRVTDTLFIEQTKNNDYTNTDYYIRERLPEWIIKTEIFDNFKLKDKYQLENRLNPLYLEADFNGDGHIDIALPIKEIETDKVGFVIVHGKSNEIHIVGAGTKIRNGLSDDMGYIDIWKVNRQRINEAGLEENTGTGKEGELILKNPSLQIEKSESGGGQIYWSGKEYSYFHQSC